MVSSFAQWKVTVTVSNKPKHGPEFGGPDFSGHWFESVNNGLRHRLGQARTRAQMRILIGSNGMKVGYTWPNA